MSQYLFEYPSSNMLAHIVEGMAVYDCNEKKVGIVRYMQNRMGTVNVPSESSELPPDAPLELCKQLIGGGFIKIDRGLLLSHRYAKLEEVEAVYKEGVWLKVTEDALLKL